MLDGHGKLAIVEIVLYVPALLFCLWNNLHYGFQRRFGWVSLTIFCAIKIAGAGMTIAIESDDDTGIVTTATILNSVALTPLLLATLSFLNSGFDSANGREQKPVVHSRLPRLLRVVHIIVMIALILGITGAIDRTKSDQGSIDNGATMLKVAAALYFITWAALALATVAYWSQRSYLSSTARRLLLSVTLALPFLLVRIIYSALNAINLDTSTSTGHTTEFNPVTGSWILYLILGLAMEIIVVATYAVTGLLNQFKGGRHSRSRGYSGVELESSGYE